MRLQVAIVTAMCFYKWYISLREIQRLQLAGSSSTVFAVNLILYYCEKQPSLKLRRARRDGCIQTLEHW